MQGTSPSAAAWSAASLASLAHCAAARLLSAARRLRPAPRAGRIEVALADWQAWSTPVGKGGATVQCLEGQLWVTHQGDREDHLLQAGDELRIPTGGRLAMVALGAARGVVAGELSPP